MKKYQRIKRNKKMREMAKALEGKQGKYILFKLREWLREQENELTDRQIINILGG